MRLVLHPKVYSDIDSIMNYYEQVATPELADEFYSELRHSMAEAARTPNAFQFGSKISGEAMSDAFHIIFFFVWLAMRCEFS